MLITDDMITDDKMGDRSTDSAAMLPYWQLVDDIVKGRDAVIAQGSKYLPKFIKEEQEDYDERLSLAKFTNVYRDVVENLASKPFEKEVVLTTDAASKAPPQITDFMEDVDGSGSNMSGFSSATFFNGINYSVDWIFIDYPTIETDNPERPRTVAEEKELGLRPFWSHVLGINVLEAKSNTHKGKEKWSVIRILEPGDINHVRRMVRDGDTAYYEIWQEVTDDAKSKKTWWKVKSGPISIGEIPMVMFYTGRRDGKRYYFYPPMRDAADMQIELYQQESGNKFIRNISAYPMLAGQGVEPEMKPDKITPKPIGIGPMRALYARPNGKGNSGHWEFLQPDAGLMTYLKEDVKDTINQLRELGRQPLTAQSGNLTVITTAVAAGKARSAVAAWALGLKNALENALVITAKWMNLKDYDPSVEVYTDFDNFSDNADDLTHLRDMRKNGDLSQDTYWYESKRRGVLSDDFNSEKEIEKLLKEIPGDVDLDENGNPLQNQPIPEPAPGMKPNAQKNPAV